MLRLEKRSNKVSEVLKSLYFHEIMYVCNQTSEFNQKLLERFLKT